MMKKLLLQTAIAALVSTGVASSVMAAAPTPVSAIANVTLQGTGVYQPTATAKSALNLVLPIKNGLPINSFGSNAANSSVQLNTLYDTKNVAKFSGCVEITNIDKTKNNGGISKISIGEKLNLASKTTNALLPSNGNALLKTDTITQVKMFEGASCLVEKPTSGTIPITVAAKGDLTLTGTELDSSSAKPTKDKIAVYYQLDKNALGNLLINPQLLSATKNEELTGSLDFTLTLTP